jgi:hypothetical protein
MAATDAVSSRSPVRSELLCLSEIKHRLTEEARVLLTCYSSKQRLPKRKGKETDKKKRTLTDCQVVS